MTPDQATERLSPVVRRWHDRGAALAVPNGPATRIWREGPREGGAPVVCLHGVPASAYLYRKVLPELASRGLEGVALDLPGLGFADRPHPADFPYTWTALGGWLERALNAAGIGAFHLVVHDLGGPVGYDLIRRAMADDPARVRSLTVLNTLTRVAAFRKPWVMRPFTVPVLDRLWTLQLATPLILPFFRWQRVLNGPSNAEIRAYGELLIRDDGGRAFRAIMKRFETTAAFEARILAALRDRTFPAQVVWGKDDPALRVERHGEHAREALGLERIHTVAGKHFLQEDSPAEIAERVARLVEGGEDL